MCGHTCICESMHRCGHQCVHAHVGDAIVAANAFAKTRARWFLAAMIWRGDGSAKCRRTLLADASSALLCLHACIAVPCRAVPCRAVPCRAVPCRAYVLCPPACLRACLYVCTNARVRTSVMRQQLATTAVAIWRPACTMLVFDVAGFGCPPPSSCRELAALAQPTPRPACPADLQSWALFPSHFPT